ncbi:MAG TPA: terminase small subunit [Mucilaginibacter sp.]
MRKKKDRFSSADQLDALIAQYFEQLAGHSVENEPTNKTDAEKKKLTVLSEPSTITGLAFHLGFSSRQAFEDYEAKGKFADHLQRARLRIMADYEKKLHVTSSTGAIFALKSMGWNEQKPADELADQVLKIEIVQSGPPLSSAENEVTL